MLLITLASITLVIGWLAVVAFTWPPLVTPAPLPLLVPSQPAGRHASTDIAPLTDYVPRHAAPATVLTLASDYLHSPTPANLLTLQRAAHAHLLRTASLTLPVPTLGPQRDHRGHFLPGNTTTAPRDRSGRFTSLAA